MEAMNAHMTKDLSLKEIVEAIISLPKGKAPGHDAIPTEFFQEYVEEVAPMLLLAFKAMLAQGRTSYHINKGLITLILKSGDHSKLGNWRLITLLDNTYKILAKTLAGKIQASLPLVIKPNQTRFVEGRSILDYIFLAQEALDWVAESEQDLVLLLLEFEKAFDRIEWGFLFPALSKMGFSAKWIHWISSLYWSSSSSFKVNSEANEAFKLTRLVRQGCPLAPYLFILATDMLGHMLDDPKHKIEGLNLPRRGYVRD
jgi:hypothetical protein